MWTVNLWVPHQSVYGALGMGKLLVGNIVEPSVAWLDNGSVEPLSVLQGPQRDVALSRCVGPQRPRWTVYLCGHH